MHSCKRYAMGAVTTLLVARAVATPPIAGTNASREEQTAVVVGSGSKYDRPTVNEHAAPEGGTATPINQLASVSIPEPRQILVKPFDASVLKEVSKAIMQTDLGSAPQDDGKVIRLTLPPLSGEQRKKYAAKVKEMCEETRVAMRNTRRDLNKSSDAMKKSDRVLLIDDLIATGGTATAAIDLVHDTGADVVAAAFIVDLPDLGGSAKLRERGVKFHTLVEFEGE